MTNQAAQTMPELPEPYKKGRAEIPGRGPWDIDCGAGPDLYTADQMRTYARAALAAPRQEGPHPDALPDGTLSKSTAKRVEALAAASVSERARSASLKEIVPAEKRNYLDDSGNPRSIEDEAYAHGWNACRAATIRALEQALTQQRGKREDAHKFRRLAQLLDGFDFRLGRNALMPPATYLDSVEITCEFQPGIGQSVIDAIVDVLATEKRND